MAIVHLQEPVRYDQPGPVFFAAGFRPFFLFAALDAAVMLPLWLAVYGGALSVGRLPPAVWHGHEMVYGFAAAAAGGFLLTAVPSWTGCRYVSGRPLMGLFALWLAGRVAFSLGALLPAGVVAAADLAYLPVLALLLARPLVAAGKWHNIAFLPMLAALWLSDVVVHLGLAGIGDPMVGVRLGVALLLVMITVVGGRIIPSFTEHGLAMQGVRVTARRIRWIERWGAVASVVTALGLATVLPGSAAAGAALLAASAVHAVRLSGWRGGRTFGVPLLWVLHLGYLWLVAGLALSGLAAFGLGLTASAALHALTAGCVGTMILAVMSRAALGHSGRPLQAAPATVAAYVLVSAGALLRVLGAVNSGGAAWVSGWVLFTIVYLPIVIRPRADGRPG